MAPLQSSGTTIKISDIRNEFGITPNKNFGAYRVNQSIAGKNWPLDDGIPTSGTIRFSDFYGKRLNIVIDSGTGNDEYNANLENYWTNTNKIKTCVGGFKTPRSTLANQGDKKYHVVLRKDYGGITYGVKTGDWSATNGGILNIHVSAGCTVYGRGGDGGNGSGDGGGNGTAGQPGLDAMGFTYSSTVIVDGGILAGAGGGGGGKGGYWDTPDDPLEWHQGGGGGGGGRGHPGGAGGIAQLSNDPGVNRAGQNGSSGSKASGGKGGNGRTGQPAPGGGGGGGGGWSTNTRGAGGTPNGVAGTTTGRGGSGNAGASGGQPGRALVKTAETTVTIIKNASGIILPSQTPVDVPFIP